MSSQKLYRTVVKAAAEAADDITPPKNINLMVEAASQKEALKEAKKAIHMNPETRKLTEGKVVVDVEEFNKLPTQQKFQIAAPKEVRKVTASASGKKTGEQGEAIVQPHKLTVGDVEYDIPAFDPKDPKFGPIGMRSASGDDLFTLGDANIKEQNLTIFPNFVEKALSNDANPKMRNLGRFFGISDDMDKGVAGWANNGGLFGRAINTTKYNAIPAVGLEMLSSKMSDTGELWGNGMFSKTTGAVGERIGLKKSDEEKVGEEQAVRERKANESREDKALTVVSSMSPAGMFSRPALEFNNQRIAQAVGDKSPDGRLAIRTFGETVRGHIPSAQGDTGEERLVNATRMMFERMSADQIVESLLFNATTAEKRLHEEQSEIAKKNGGEIPDLKPTAQAGFAKYLQSVKSDDGKNPYITFPTSMTSSFHHGQPRTGFRVKVDLGDGVTEERFVVPVIVPKKTNAEQVAGTKAGKKGDLNTPTLASKMSEGDWEVMYLDANPRNKMKPAIPANKVIWQTP